MGKFWVGKDLWTERVDYTNFLCRIWPRAGVIASNLWGIAESQSLRDRSDRESVLFVRDVDRKIYEKYRMYILYSAFKDLLESSLNMNLSPIILHTVDEPTNASLLSKTFSMVKDLTYTPTTVGSAYELVSSLRPYFFPDPLSTTFNGSSYLNKTLMIRLNSQLSCRCSGISAQRPLISEIREIGADDSVYGVDDYEQFVSIVQLNTANGAQGTRRRNLIEWLQVQSHEE